MGGSKLKNTISKRRPRQNIIYLILKNAKDKHKKRSKSSKSSVETSASSTSNNDVNTNSANNSNGGYKQQYYGNKRGILASAVELTRRSKKITSRSKSSRKSKSNSSSSITNKKGILTKGQRAFYKSPKGITKVTIVGIHHDSNLKPYYTIKLRDGKEKQTDGMHLTPIIQQFAVNINSFAKQILSIRGKQNGNRTYNRTDAVSQLG